jgi:hypothetical protein
MIWFIFQTYTVTITKTPMKLLFNKLNIIFLIQNSVKDRVEFPRLNLESIRKAVMRMLFGSINPFITVYNIGEINPSITDVIYLSISRSITKYSTNYNRVYRRLWNMESITKLFKV